MQQAENDFALQQFVFGRAGRQQPLPESERIVVRQPALRVLGPQRITPGIAIFLAMHHGGDAGFIQQARDCLLESGAQGRDDAAEEGG